MKTLVKYLDISDTSITASSERNVQHAAKRVRVDRYLDYACAWAAAPNDRKVWIQFDMEQDVTVWGVLWKPRCDEPYTDQRVTSLKVVMSNDRVRWHDVSEVITPNYSVDNISTSWFDEAATAQYWRIQVLAWHIQPSLKADLLGHPTGKHWLRYVCASLSCVLIISTMHHVTG